MPPTIRSSTVMGKPPPKMTRRSMPPTAPAASGGSSLMKSCQPPLGMPKPIAVYALSWAIWTLSRAAPSIRLNDLSTPDSSQTAITMGTPSSAALASAAAITRCARSLVTLAFSNTSLTASPLCQVGEAILQLADLRDADEVEKLVKAGQRGKHLARGALLAD